MILLLSSFRNRRENDHRFSMTIMERGLVSIDQWTAWSQAYFLTHLPSEHSSGLSALCSKGPVFCSHLSAKLFPFKFPDFKLSLLCILDIGSWHTLPLVSPSTGSKSLIEVMAIDAHHCPGAVMFLFRGDFGYSLCTGDFRWEVNSERARTGRSMLLSALMVVQLTPFTWIIHIAISFPSS